MFKNCKKRIKSKWETFRSKHNLLNLLTTLIAIIAILSFLIMVAILIYNKFEFEKVMQICANHVTIFAFAIGAVQLIAFVKDTRHTETRAKKEFALDLAKEYATNLLPKMNIIENVLSRSYNKENPFELQKCVLSKLEINNFTRAELLSNELLDKYKDFFSTKQYPYETELILQIFEYYEKVNALIPKPSECENEDEFNKNVTRKFRFLIACTLNELEQFAMAVNNQIADSTMLFPSLHQTFLEFVKYTYPRIADSNHDDVEEFYTNIILLYRDWNQKKTENDIYIKAQKEKINKHYTKDSKPLGFN